MSYFGNILKRITGRPVETGKPKVEPPRPTTPATASPTPAAAAPVRKWPPVTERVEQHQGPGPSPTARVLNKFPDVKAVGEAVYDGQVPPRPGPLAEKKPTEKENIFQPRGTRPEPTAVTPGVGGPGGGFAGPRPAPPPPPPPGPAPAPAPARKPPIKTFDQFIGGNKPGHKL